MYAVAIMHPAAILRGQWANEPLQHEWLSRARALAEGRLAPHTLEDLVACGLPDPTPDELEAWVRDTLALGCGVAVDIECAGTVLRCVGVARLAEPPVPTLFNFRAQGGSPVGGTLEETARVVACLDALLGSHLPKWFHNGQAFDVPYLERLGFVVNNYAGDTMLLQRYLYPEAPADLQSVATFYCGYPGWKHLAHNDEEGEGK